LAAEECVAEKKLVALPHWFAKLVWNGAFELPTTPR
jgi:hypothetical protein